MHDRRKTMHRKSSSLHMDASTATGWLAELGEAARGLGEVSNGISNGSLCDTAGESNGRDNQWVSSPPSGVGERGWSALWCCSIYRSEVSGQQYCCGNRVLIIMTIFCVYYTRYTIPTLAPWHKTGVHCICMRKGREHA